MPPLPVRGAFAKDIARRCADQRRVLFSKIRAGIEYKHDLFESISYKVKCCNLGSFVAAKINIGVGVRGLAMSNDQAIFDNPPRDLFWVLLRSGSEEIGDDPFWNEGLVKDLQKIYPRLW